MKETPLVGEVIIAVSGQRSPRIGWPRAKIRVCPIPHTCLVLQPPLQPTSDHSWASTLSPSPGPPRSTSRQRVTPVTSTPTFARHKFRLTGHHLKVVLGILLSFVVTALWVAMTQLAKSSYKREEGTFVAPFFIVYFSMAWMVVIYPAYLMGHLISVGGKMSLKETFREDAQVYGSGRRHPAKSVVTVVCFSLLWFVSSYVYIRALDMKPCFDVIILFSTNSSFAYLLAWILLHKQFMPLRIMAILLAMTGICMVTYMDGGFSSQSIWGAVLAVTSTSGAASYKVLFRKVAGEATLGQISLFLSCISLFSTVTLWPILLLLYFTKAEPIDWDRVPWYIVCGTAGTALLLNFILHHGASATYPVLLQISFMTAVPLCAAVDLLWRHETFTGMQVAASVVVILSSLLNLLPAEVPTCLSRVVTFKPRHETATPTNSTTTNRQAPTTNSTTRPKTATTTATSTLHPPSTTTACTTSGRVRPNKIVGPSATGTTTTFFGPRQTIRSTAC